MTNLVNEEGKESEALVYRNTFEIIIPIWTVHKDEDCQSQLTSFNLYNMRSNTLKELISVKSENIFNGASIAIDHDNDMLYIVSKMAIHRIDVQTKKVDILFKGETYLNPSTATMKSVIIGKELHIVSFNNDNIHNGIHILTIYE